MSAKRLLQTFDRVSNTPGATSRLRRFVLDMAVRGLLVEQDSGDGDAAAILEQATVPQLDRSRRTALSAEFPDLSEVPYEVPDSWVWCRLNQIGLIIGGGTPPSEDADNFTAGGSGIAWLTPADMAGQAELEVQHGARDLTERGLHSSSATLMPKGTVLFTSRAPIGYVGVAAQDITTNQGFKSLVPSNAVDPRYAAIFFRAFAPAIDAAAPGTTFKEVSGKIVSRLPFPLPPLCEQQRIVARVDELMALCDQLELAQRERELQRGALRAASLHRLTSGDPEADKTMDVRFFLDTSSRLFTNSDHVAPLRQTLVDLAVNGLLGTHAPAEGAGSAGWITAELRGLLSRLQTGPFGTALHKSDYVLGGTPVVNPASMIDGRIVPSPKMTIGPRTLDRLSSFKMRENDIVMARRGEMGRCAVVTAVEEGWLCGTGSLLLRFPSTISAHFLALLIGSPSVRQYLGGSAVGSTMQNLNQSILLSLQVNLPPLPEQQRIVARVQELMTLCQQLEIALESSQEERARLLEALLHESLVNS